MTGALRTPEERFAGLPDFEYEPRYHDWEGLRLAYLDAGEGPPVVLFHGEPTWSFLYRTTIAALVTAGYRAIAPDLPGFGRSDKPTDPAFYTYDRHTAAMASLLGALRVSGAAAVVHDWGGPIGLRLAVDIPGMFTRLTVLNTGLFTGGPVSEGFLRWRAHVERSPVLDVGRVMRRSAARPWPEEVIAGYEAPFPVPDSTIGAQRFPLIVPLTGDDPGAAEMRRVRIALKRFEGPAQVLFSTGDPIFGLDAGERWTALLPGAGSLETVDDAGHFLQEDRSEAVAAAIVAFLVRTGAA
jgi:haloalkane dehalogenase